MACPYRQPEFGPWNSVYVRFSCWSDKNVWQNVFEVLREDADYEEVYLDSTIVRAHQHASGAAKKKRKPSSWLFSEWINDQNPRLRRRLWQLARFIITAGQINDITQAEALIETIEPYADLVDKAYDAAALLKCIGDKKAKAVIPSTAVRKAQREDDRSQYRNRNVIERFFAKLKQFRRVGTRYEKLLNRVALVVALTATVLWLR